MASFDDLPPALQLCVVTFLPLLERIRCSLVSKRWRSWLCQPAFWADLDFHGVPFVPRGLGLEDLLEFCRRSKRQLRSLDLSTYFEGWNERDMRIDGEPVFAILAAEGLAGKLESPDALSRTPRLLRDGSQSPAAARLVSGSEALHRPGLWNLAGKHCCAARTRAAPHSGEERCRNQTR